VEKWTDKIPWHPMKCRTPIWQWGSRHQERKSHASLGSEDGATVLSSTQPTPLLASHIAARKTHNFLFE
jgi:hypothetical protein